MEQNITKIMIHRCFKASVLHCNSMQVSLWLKIIFRNIMPIIICLFNISLNLIFIVFSFHKKIWHLKTMNIKKDRLIICRKMINLNILDYKIWLLSDILLDYSITVITSTTMTRKIIKHTPATAHGSNYSSNYCFNLHLGYKM